MLESGSHQNVAVDSLNGKLMFRACHVYSNSSQVLSPIVSLLNPVPVSLENQARIYRRVIVVLLCTQFCFSDRTF